ncbi:MAG: DUF192 domain-containing protein [Bacillus sp. (in: firmicutes)]
MKILRNNFEIELPLRIIVCDRFWPRFKGLMFRMVPIVDEGILLVPCNSIHMFFMFFSIDVVFLDENDVVVAVREKVKPNRLILPVARAVKTLELPVGAVGKHSIGVGDRILY